MKNAKSKSINLAIELEPMLAALILFVSAGPYFSWGVLASPVFILLKLVFVFICYKNRELSKRDGAFFVFWGMIVFYSFLLAIFHDRANIIGLINQLTYIFYFFILFTNVTFCKKVFNYFFTVFAIILGLSLTVWLFSSTFHISPLRSVSFMQSGELRTYEIYPFLVKEVGFNLRFYGPFDEPGSIGTIGGLLLCITRFSLKDWKTWIILVAGILSFSLFFYVLIIVYALIYSVVVKKSIIPALLICVGIIVFYNKTKDDEVFYLLIWNRLEWNDEGGTINGDSRMTADGTAYYERIKGTPEFLFGVNNYDLFWRAAAGSSSYKVVIMSDGLIFFALYVLFFIVYARRKIGSFSLWLLFCFIFLANTYQRPDIYGILMMFLYSVLARQEVIICVSNNK